MKKLLGLLAVSPMAITACGGTKEDTTPDKEPGTVDTTVSVKLISGPTGIGGAKLTEDDAYDVEIAAGSTAWDADVLKCNFEAVALPLDKAWSLFNNDTVADDCGLEVASVIASNMLQFVTQTDAATDLADINGKEIWAPASETVQGIIQEFIDINETNWTTKPTVVGKSTDEIFAELGNNADAIAVLPEPAVTAQVVSASRVRGSALIDVTGGEELANRPIGVLALNKTWAEDNETEVTTLLSDYKTSVEFMTDTTNIDAAAKLATELTITPSEGVAKQAIPNSEVEWIVGEAAASDIMGFVEEIVGETISNETAVELVYGFNA